MLKFLRRIYQILFFPENTIYEKRSFQLYNTPSEYQNVSSISYFFVGTVVVVCWHEYHIFILFLFISGFFGLSKMHSFGTQIAHIASAILLKITCSSDDLAWLTPFVIHRTWYALCYVLAMEIVVNIFFFHSIFLWQDCFFLQIYFSFFFF